MAPRQRQRIVLTAAPPSPHHQSPLVEQLGDDDEDLLSPSPSETSSDCCTTTTTTEESYTTTTTAANHYHCINSSMDYRTKADAAKEDHDLFNLFALVFVVTASCMNWNLRGVVQFGPQASWTGDYFFTSVIVTAGYFLIDLIWVAYIPISVKSPGTIIKHHFLAIAYLAGPVLYPEYRWFMGACLTVEINTWFLILRRVLFKRKANVLLQNAVDAGFYTSWIAVRVILYPVIMYLFCSMAVDRVYESGYLFHWPMMFIPVHGFLCVLNLKWTYDLFLPFFIQQPQPLQPASGL